MAFSIKNHKISSDTSMVRFVDSPNVGGKLKNPRFLVIHYTASGAGSDIAQYFARDSANVSAHLVIRRDGSMSQCVPFNTVAWHAGQSSWTDKDGTKFVGLNKHSIGIEIENWGPLKSNGAGWVSWTGAQVEAGLVIEARHKFGLPTGGWETFTQAQVQTTIEAAQAICREYSIDQIVGHDDISPGRKSDPGPAWAMDSFRAKVLGRAQNGGAELFVRSPTGLNIRTGPGASFPKIQDMPLPDGTQVLLHEAEAQWRYVSVLDKKGNPEFSGWVHGNWLAPV